MTQILLALLDSTMRMSMPLLFAALGGLLSERSGVVNIALEGLMLIGAFCGVVVTLGSHSPTLGLFGAAAGGAALAGLYGVTVIRWRADQIVAGTAINFLAFGVPPVLCKLWFNSTTSTPSLPIEERFTLAPLVMGWIALSIVAAWLRWTRSGLWLQFAGESPESLHAAGVSVKRVRWGALLAAGVLAGLGGATLSMCLSSSYTKDMTAGRGFMALAALILGKWRPVPTALACVLFGFFDALQMQLQGASFLAEFHVPVQFIQILPYWVTVLVLAGFVGQARAPRRLGVPFAT
ncbi:MAG: ABC transporter permease [Bacteriovoracia bacterium]